MVKVSGDSDNGDQVRGLATFRKLTTILTFKLLTNIFHFISVDAHFNFTTKH